jgi:outer membrane lipoprotein-sorting protein
MTARAKKTKYKKSMGENIPNQSALRIYLTLFFMMIGTLLVQGQDFKQALLVMRDKYKALEKVRIVMHVRVADEGSAVAFYDETVEIIKDHHNYLYQFGGQDMLMNEKYLVMVDRSSREIICSQRDLKTETLYLPKDPFQANLDSLFAFYGQPKYMGRKEQTDHYRISLNSGEVKGIDLFIDTESNLFRKVQYQYRDNQQAVIDFKVFDVNPQFEPDMFDEGKYVVVSGTSVKPSKNFLNYHVVNVETENETSH